MAETMYDPAHYGDQTLPTLGRAALFHDVFPDLNMRALNTELDTRSPVFILFYTEGRGLPISELEEKLIDQDCDATLTCVRSLVNFSRAGGYDFREARIAKFGISTVTKPHRDGGEPSMLFVVMPCLTTYNLNGDLINEPEEHHFSHFPPGVKPEPTHYGFTTVTGNSGSVLAINNLPKHKKDRAAHRVVATTGNRLGITLL